MEWNVMEWNGMNRMDKLNGMEWRDSNGMKLRNESMEWNWNGNESNRMEREFS